MGHFEPISSNYCNKRFGAGGGSCTRLVRVTRAVLFSKSDTSTSDPWRNRTSHRRLNRALLHQSADGPTAPSKIDGAFEATSHHSERSASEFMDCQTAEIAGLRSWTGSEGRTRTGGFRDRWTAIVLSPKKAIEGLEGIQPSTGWVRTSHSAIELEAQVLLGSLAGFEPATRRVKVDRSCPLTYRLAWFRRSLELRFPFHPSSPIRLSGDSSTEPHSARIQAPNAEGRLGFPRRPSTCSDLYPCSCGRLGTSRPGLVALRENAGHLLIHARHTHPRNTPRRRRRLRRDALGGSQVRKHDRVDLMTRNEFGQVGYEQV
jgi:hypothetical protein